MWLLLYRERIGVALLVLILGVMLYFGSQGSVSPSIVGTIAVPSNTKLMLVKTSKDADAVTTITHYGDEAHPLHLYRQHWGGERADPGELKAQDAQGHLLWHVEDTTYYGLIDPGLDVGGFAGYARWRAADQNHHQFQVGLRISPVRALYGTLSPDLLFTSEAVGIGISVYAPPAWAGDSWSHLGLGVGHLYGYHGGSANIGYLSFSFVY